MGKMNLRFVMNSQFVTAGYPWVIVLVERLQEFMEAMEKTIATLGNRYW